MLARLFDAHMTEVSILIILGLLVAAFFLRYIMFAGGALIALNMFRTRLLPRRIQPIDVTLSQMKRETAYSLMTSLVFAGVASAAFIADKSFSIFRLYDDIASHGWSWFWLSIPCALLVHDFYFYWAHRFMHLPGVFERVHRVHHLSTNPSPLAAFAFHPIEAVIEALGFVLILALVPMHPLAFLAVSTVMITMNVIGHLGYEIFPGGLVSHPLARLINTSTSHNQHHRSFRSNYGLYTMIWDRLFGTVHPGYEGLYAKVTGTPAALSTKETVK